MVPRPTQRSARALRRREVDEEADCDPERADCDCPPHDEQEGVENAVASTDMPAGGDGQHRADDAQRDPDPEPDRESEPMPGRACFLLLVDRVQTGHAGADHGGDVPDREQPGEGDQSCRLLMEDLQRSGVDRLVRRVREVVLEGRRELLAPDILEAEGAEKREPEQRERNERDESAQRNCAGVVEDLVAVEAVDPEIDG
jgi:hypothetical protein